MRRRSSRITQRLALSLWLGAGLVPNALPDPYPTAAPALTLTLSPASVVGGTKATGTATLSAPAPPGGTPVTLTSSAITVAGLAAPLLGPASVVSITRVMVPEGHSSLTFEVRTSPVVALSQVTIGAATSTESAAAILAVTSPSPATVQIAPATTPSGTSVTGTVVLNGAAPTGGFVVALRSSSTAATVPATATVPALNDRAAFTIATFPVSTSTRVAITASSSATSAQATGHLGLLPLNVQSLQIESGPPGGNYSALGGRMVSGIAMLNGRAPRGGLVVALTSGNVAAAVPPSATVPEGSDHVKFSIITQPVTSTTPVSIGATARTVSQTNTSVTDGTSNTIQLGNGLIAEATATLTLFAIPRLLSIAATPSPVTGGDTLSVTFKLALPLAGSTALPELARARIIVDRPDLVQLPNVFAVPAALGPVGGNGVPAIVAKGTTTTPNADAMVTITATLGGRSASTTVLVRKPLPAIASFTLRPTTSKGGNNVIASVLLTAAVVTPTIVALTADRPDLVQLPTSITVAPSPVPQPLTITTSAVTAPVTVTITAAAGVQRVTSTVTLTP